jgi:hypothetical protein
MEITDMPPKQDFAKQHSGKTESYINKAVKPHMTSGLKKTKDAAAKGMGSDVGGEKKAEMNEALRGNPNDKNPLVHAVRELHEQHPEKHHDRGPHHGKEHHIRHEPLHGLKPSAH